MGHLYMILLLEFPSKRVSGLIDPGGGGVLGLIFVGYACAAGLLEPLPHYSLFCGQL